MSGKVQNNGSTHTVNFWEEIAIYVIHDQFETVYLGKALSSNLGCWLRDNLTDRFAGRWNIFSWFTLFTVNTINPCLRALGTRQLLDTIGALTIAITDPALNRKRESIPKANEAVQVGALPKAIRSNFERVLK